MKVLDNPVVTYLIIGSFSLFAAWLMFQIGGSLAEVSGQQDSVLGLGFKAGGAFGGFIIVFWLSQRVLKELRETAPKQDPLIIRVPLLPKPSRFSRSTVYRCTYWVLDPVSGQRKAVKAEPVWEAGVLTVYVRDVGQNESVQVRVEDAKTVWESDYFSPRTNEVVVEQLDVTAPAVP